MTPYISGITDAKDSVRKRLCQEAAFASNQALCLGVFSVPQEFSARGKVTIVGCVDIFRLCFQKIFLSEPQVQMNSRSLLAKHFLCPTVSFLQQRENNIPTSAFLSLPT